MQLFPKTRYWYIYPVAGLWNFFICLLLHKWLIIESGKHMCNSNWWTITILSGNLLAQKRGQWTNELFHSVITQIHWAKEGPLGHK